MDNYKFPFNVLPTSVTTRLSILARNVSTLWAMFLGYIAIILPGPNPLLGTVTLISMAHATLSEWIRSRQQNSS